MPAVVRVQNASMWLSRRDVLESIVRCCPEPALIATTGHIGRAMYEIGDSDRQLYVVGGMGCASSVALGLALSDSSRRIVVVDGDGAALMRLGAMPTIGRYRPNNLVHVLLDNQVHESTGGQETATGSTDLAAVAAACGYPHVVRAESAHHVADTVRSSSALTFVHAKVRPEYSTQLPRPSVGPPQAAIRFRQWFTRSDVLSVVS